VSEDSGEGPSDFAPGVATALLIIGVLAFVIVTVSWVPFLVRAFDYNSAYRCSSTANAACYTEQRDVVLALGTDGAGDVKNSKAFVQLRQYGRFDLTSGAGLWSAAHVGDPATVRIYHGAVQTIEVRGYTAETADNPDLSAKAATGLEVAALGLLLGGLAVYGRRRRTGRFARSAYVYATWAYVSAVVVGFAVGSGPPPIWIAFASISLVIGVLIGAEFFVLQPRIEARKAEEEGWDD
jgi:hypothetical protein